MTMATSSQATVPAQLVNAIRQRRFTQVARLFAPNVDFQAWTPAGHWVATDPTTASRIIEVWYTPGVNSTVVDIHETSNARSATLEVEMSWKTELEDQPRTLRQVYLLTLKDGKITQARVYCPGLHTDFPDVDLEKQRRAKGIGGAKPSNAPKMVPARVT